MSDIRSKPSNKAYDEGWERTFGEPKRRREAEEAAAQAKARKEFARWVAKATCKPNPWLERIKDK